MYNKDSQDFKGVTSDAHTTFLPIHGADDTITIPRSEYAELVAYNTLMYVVSKLAASDLPDYTLIDVLNALLPHGRKAGEAKAAGGDEGDAE